MSDKIEKKSIDFSIVIPVYNSEKSLENLCNRIHKVFNLRKEFYEIVLVDDCSKDNSWYVMNSLRKYNSNIKIVQLMSNFGQHNAILCGLNYISGKYVITMDDDLQNPPEEIPKLIDEIKKGYDAVIGALEIKQDTMIKNTASAAMRFLMRKIFNMPADLKFSSFRIMTCEIANEVKNFKTPYPFIGGMIFSLTQNITNVKVKHEKRKYGTSTYNYGKLINLAFNLIINYTSLPLKMLTFIGILVSILSFSLGLFFIIQKLVYQIAVPGWTTVVVLISFFNGLLLLTIAIMGEYLSRIIGEVSGRRQYVVRRKEL